MGAIDLIEEVEKTFSFRMTKDEAERCETVGDLYAVICAHSPYWDMQVGNCASSMTFYRIRKSLAPRDGSKIDPNPPLLDGTVSPAQLFKTLGKNTGLRLPSFQLTRSGFIGTYLFVAGLIGCIFAVLESIWLVGGIAAPAVFIGALLIKLDPGKLPEGVLTVGDLARRAAPLNSEKLRLDGGRPADRWSVLAALASEHGVLPPDEIGPETFLHFKSLKVATR